MVSPEVLGLPAASEKAELGLVRGRPRLAEALLAGDEELARRIVFDLYLANHSMSVICDEVVVGAFREIGERWACNEADVYQERRGCEIVMRIIHELRRMQSPPDHAWTAIGGTIEGDSYTLPSAMAELLLRDAGFHATSLGSAIPFSSLIKAVEELRPRLFWLSVSHIADGVDFVTEFARLSRACATSQTALVVGGRALTEELRRQLTYSAYCDTLKHLEAFATTLIRSSKRTRRSSSSRQRQPARVKKSKKVGRR